MFLAHICPFSALLLSIPSEAMPQSGSISTISNQNFCNETCEESATCPEGFTSIMNKCFKIVNKDLNWEDSKNECLSLGGSLAIVNDCNLLNPLYKFLKNSTPNSDIIWIGASDEEIEGEWIWIDGTKVQMGVPFWSSFFNNIEPSGGVNENCAQIDPTLQYYFNDINCSSSGTPLCQAEPSSVEKTNCVCSDAYGDCPDGFDAVGEFCYYLPHDPNNFTLATTFDEAKSACSNFYPGADLPILESCNEFTELVDFINENDKYKTTNPYWLNAKRGNDGDILSFYWGNNKKLESGPPYWGNLPRGEQPSADLIQNCTISWGYSNFYLFHFPCGNSLFAFPLCQVRPILQD